MSTMAALPSLAIQVDSRLLSASTAGALEEIHIQQRLSQPGLCEMTFFSTGDSSPDLEGISAGSLVEMTVPSSRKTLFQGEITAIEYGYEAAHGQTIRLRCYDVLHRLRKRQPVRVHV